MSLFVFLVFCAPATTSRFSTPGTGFEVLSCPAKLPHDLAVGQKLARWFGPPYNAWYVGSVAEVNNRRKKSENVSVAFKDDMYGETVGKFVAEANTYGADKQWVLLAPISIDLDSDDDDEAAAGASSPTPTATSATKRSPDEGASSSSGSAKKAKA